MLSLGFIFWLIMLLWVLYGVGWHQGWVSSAHGPLGNSIILFVLFLLLGLKSFGQPISF